MPFHSSEIHSSAAHTALIYNRFNLQLLLLLLQREGAAARVPVFFFLRFLSALGVLVALPSTSTALRPRRRSFCRKAT